MDLALAELIASSTVSITDAARRHGITRSALSKRFHAKISSRAQGAESRRMLNNKQEEELMYHIHHICERCLPPTPQIVANIAEERYDGKLSKDWSSRFVARRKHRLHTGLFETETAPKARKSDRLLFVHDHSSHVNMKFVNWCEKHKILLAAICLTLLTDCSLWT